ncbi:phosphoribosylanthranilate isomerase [Metabacillus sp. 84]|uniref:phosphoribosylanthranilate isomerase n=1 Tax=unclassified Metabacillus TaxID=2675274 RepID=UPI003CFA3161
MKRPLLKYCGNKSKADYRLSLGSGADYIGFIFAESKRRTEPEEVRKWISECGRGGKKLVGVFVNPSLEETILACKTLNLDTVQFHGEESAEFLEAFKGSSQTKVWKAIRHDADACKKMEHYAPYTDGFLIDSKVQGAWGGTGIAFDWSACGDYVRQAEKLGKFCFIAGGIHEANVKELLDRKPGGIDLASGLERNGSKDAEMIKNFEKRVDDYVSGQ